MLVQLLYGRFDGKEQDIPNAENTDELFFKIVELGSPGIAAIYSKHHKRHDRFVFTGYIPISKLCKKVQSPIIRKGE